MNGKHIAKKKKEEMRNDKGAWVQIAQSMERSYAYPLKEKQEKQ